MSYVIRQFKPDRLLKNIYDLVKKFTAFRTRKKPDKIGLFSGNIFFVSQYVYVRQNLVFRAIFESVSNEKVTNDFSISVSFALF